MTELLILVESPFTQRDFERFGVATLSRSFRVSVLDCTTWLKPGFAAKYGDTVFVCDGYVSIPDAQSLARRLDGATPSIAIDYLGDTSACAAVRRELGARGIPRAVIQGGLLPRPVASFSQKLKGFLRTHTPQSLLNKLFRRAFRRLQTEPAADVIMMSGSAGLESPGVQQVRHKVWAHSFDFDTYLAMSGAPTERREAYAVFLDEDMVYHSDYDHAGIRPPATDVYYTAMQRFFADLERRHGLKVIVAAHPRSRYDLRPHLWGHHEVVLGQTAALVRDARLVLCHQSTSINFAVLWQRPLLFLTSHELAVSYLQPQMTILSSLLGAPLVNVDDDAAAGASSFAVNNTAYERYREKYIKRSGTPTVPAWEIFAEYVRHELQAADAVEALDIVR